MTKELPFLGEDEIQRRAFVLGTEMYVDGRFKEQLKEEEKKDCKEIERLTNLINNQKKIEHEGFFLDDEGKKHKVCRCPNCSHERQNTADLLLAHLNEINFKYDTTMYIATFRDPKKKVWDLKLVIKDSGGE